MALTQEQKNIDKAFKAVKENIKEISDRIPVSVLGFGAVGDGVKDDTAAFRLAFKSNRTVLIPAGVYKVSDLSTISQVSNLRIIADGATILNADLTKATWLFQNCTNVNITGGDWGYSITPTANGGNSQHVVQFDKCKQVTVDDIHVLNSPEMGVAITECYKVTVKNSVIEHCFRDGTYAHSSAEVKYVNNTYRHIKDDAMSFHDYGRASERTFIAALGYTQATGITVDNCRVQYCYQGFASVAGAGISIKNSTFRNVVLAGEALMNQKALYPDGTARLTDATVDGNFFYNCCTTTVINGQPYASLGQGSTGRASIMVVSLGDGNNISLTQPKRQANVRIRNNYVSDSGALGLHCSSTDGLTLSGNTFKNCVVANNTLGGDVVEIWECTGYVEESVNTVIDTRTPVQHQRAYSFDGVTGCCNTWLVTGVADKEGRSTNSPNLQDLNPKHVLANTLKGGSATQSGNGSATVFSFPHGLGKQPSFIAVQPASPAAKNYSFLSADATSIIVNYDAPPAAVANNLIWYWSAHL